MGFFKKWRQFKEVKKIVKDIENFEKECREAKNEMDLKDYVDKIIMKYNAVNKVKIPYSLVDILYKLGQSAADGKLKNGDVKRELALEFIKVILGISGKVAMYFIQKALLKL